MPKYIIKTVTYKKIRIPLSAHIKNKGTAKFRRFFRCQKGSFIKASKQPTCKKAAAQNIAVATTP